MTTSSTFTLPTFFVLDSRTGEPLAERDSYVAALRLVDFHSEQGRAVHVVPSDSPALDLSR
jgi:hypothetical protein